MKKGLILEGGAMRGMFTAGVTDVMMEHGIDFDGAVGVSAGAAFGCNYKSKQIGRAARYNLKYCHDKRYVGLGSLIKTGNLYSEKFCYGEVPLKLDVFDFDTYNTNPMEFYVVCSDIESGEPVYHRYDGWEDHGFDWIRASASLPMVARFVEIDGRKLMDGGMTDSIPVEFFQSIGYDRNVAILTQPKEYRKEKTKTACLVKMMYRKYPKLAEAVETRHIMYNKQLDYIAKEEAEGRLFVIRPEESLPVTRMERNTEKLKTTYDIGRKIAEKVMPDLKEFLK